MKNVVNKILNIKKPNQIYIKCFQFNCVNWSNLYLGNVPLVAIAVTQKIKILNNNTKYGILKLIHYINKKLNTILFKVKFLV